MKGFSSGEGEQESYIEELENIQMYDMNPLLERHYELVIKSDLDKDYKFDIVWNSLKILSELDKATIRETDSRTDMNYVNMRALSPETVLEKLAEDKESRYHGLEIEYEDEKIEEETEWKQTMMGLSTLDMNKSVVFANWYFLDLYQNWNTQIHTFVISVQKTYKTEEEVTANE